MSTRTFTTTESVTEEHPGRVADRQWVKSALAGSSEFQHLLDRVERRELDPLGAARELSVRVFGR